MTPEGGSGERERLLAGVALAWLFLIAVSFYGGTLWRFLTR